MNTNVRMHALARALSEIGGDIAVARGRWRRAHTNMTPWETRMFDHAERAVIDIIIHIHNEIDKLELAEGEARES